MEPVTLYDLADFLGIVEHAFSGVLLYAFSAMIAFSIAWGIKRLLVEGN